ncbi:DNA mismatch repair protein Mlh1, partial [Cryptotermes secundus]|uniref:DNA mismatch repair protein Mlh1 n=1 Tax=Cryptotermes secundus TaxID=105785 RepID=UPI001454D4C3
MNSPSVIRKLDETVVNRIAAGEIIHRPANALKEMIENSLDARAGTIQVTVKSGGMKLLQIQDNGTGIRKEDLGIVCERFTTSKLEKFEDLSTIATYGFRGEALASISHVAHLTIVTKTANEQCAYRYSDSKLKAPAKPCTGNQGTQITVEDLFYNMSTRRKALKSAAEEHNRIADVVGRYAIHNSDVGFTLKKQGESLADIRTPPNSTVVDNIRTIYGNTIAKELLELKAADDALRLKLTGYISNVNYSSKKHIMLLFINHRLVESAALKKAMEQVYSVYLPKNNHPFLYLSLELDSRNIDVNVHPTKHEVHFLHEDLVLDKIKAAVEGNLLGCNTSRVFYTQAGPASWCWYAKETMAVETNKIYAHQMVRTDSSVQKLDKYFGSPAATTKPSDRPPSVSELPFSWENGSYMFGLLTLTVKDIHGFLNKVPCFWYYWIKLLLNAHCLFHSKAMNPDEAGVYGNERASGPNTPGKVECKLTSVLELRRDVEEATHVGLRALLKNSTFVGCLSPKQALIQHETKLFLCNTARLSEELFYQIMLFDFGNFGVIRFTTSTALQRVACLSSCYISRQVWIGMKKRVASIASVEKLHGSTASSCIQTTGTLSMRAVC